MRKPLYTRFQDIPQFTRTGSYNVNVSWGYVEDQLSHWKEYEDKGMSPLVLDPDYQRGHVWDEKKQRAYVEYILRGGKSSRVLYWNCGDWMGGFTAPIELVDGKQRLEAVRKFLRSELKAFGSYFKSFTDPLRVCGPDFVFCVNDLKTRAEVLQWYLDLNTGGVIHTSEEIEKVKELLDKELHGD